MFWFDCDNSTPNALTCPVRARCSVGFARYDNPKHRPDENRSSIRLVPNSPMTFGKWMRLNNCLWQPGSKSHGCAGSMSSAERCWALQFSPHMTFAQVPITHVQNALRLHWRR